MKRARPSPPANVPPGTVTLTVPIGWFSVALHVSSPDLVPADVGRLLGAEATTSQTRGVAIPRPDGGTKRMPKFGRWSVVIKPADTDEWDVNEVVRELLGRLSPDLSVWERVAELGHLQLSVGLTLTRDNQEFMLEHDLLHALGERRIRMWFDVYREDSGVPAA